MIHLLLIPLLIAFFFCFQPQQSPSKTQIINSEIPEENDGLNDTTKGEKFP